MTNGQKIRLIRREIEAEFPAMDYRDRDRIVRVWMTHPLTVFEASLSAGFATVEQNPYIDPTFDLAPSAIV